MKILKHIYKIVFSVIYLIIILSVPFWWFIPLIFNSTSDDILNWLFNKGTIYDDVKVNEKDIEKEILKKKINKLIKQA